jgi:hypothetical protein
MKLVEIELYLISYAGEYGAINTVLIEANSISEAEKLFNENFHKRKLTGVREYGVKALKKDVG